MNATKVITLDENDLFELRRLRDRIEQQRNTERQRNGDTTAQRAKSSELERELNHNIELVEKILKGANEHNRR